MIGDRVWYDTNGDGLQDAGEKGIPGSTVMITGLDGQDVDPVTAGVQTTLMMLTGDDGKYLFSGLPAGTYKVETQLSWIPPGSGQTFTTVSSFIVELPDGGEDLTNDFGVVAVVSDELPHTGLNTDTLLIVAILLTITGAGAVLVTRRKKHNGEDLAA
ncbi:MAG: LPXTG cell wall anchor domain-containing protein [Acidimicrobiia bacterium]|nr:LPXTG cell wall anchor domain-containing protein [Acidimicrobiia bacterium]